MSGSVGLVIIGRNEGHRLVRCLASVEAFAGRAVYVDSGSTDDSVAQATQRGFGVVDLDLSRPFTAARARNAGARALLARHPGLDYLQFIDGDCEVQPGWLDAGAACLDENPDIGVVFGRQQERNPDASIYNTLIDIEWRCPPGDARSATGNMMCRTQLFQQLEGFRESLIAGEDPEFCLRIRQSGARVHCLAAPMVIHDAEMFHFRQWWRRTRRGGYAFAEGAALHGHEAERHFVRERNSIVFWGGVVPVVLMLAALLSSAWFLAGFLVYPLQMLRIFIHHREALVAPAIYAVFVVIAKFPELAGLVEYSLMRTSIRERTTLIEYK